MKLNHVKDSAIQALLLVTILVALSHETKHKPNASHALDSNPQRQSLLNTKTSALSETKSTSTVRPWPSHKFFETVLAEPNKKHINVGEPLNTRSHNQKSKTSHTQQDKKLLNYQKKDKAQPLTKNSNNLNQKTTNQLISNKTQTNHPMKNNTRPSIINRDLPKTSSKSNKEFPNRISVGMQKSQNSKNKTQTMNKPHFQSPTTNLTKHKTFGTSNTTVSRIHYLSKSGQIKSTDITKLKPRMPLFSTLTKKSNELKGSKRQITPSKKSKEKSKYLTEATLPFIVTQAKLGTSPLMRNNSQPKILYKISSSLYNNNRVKTKTKIRRGNHIKAYTTDINKEDDTDKLFEWIENDNEFSVSPATNLPNFTNLKWPYIDETDEMILKDSTKQQDDEEVESTTLHYKPEYNDVGFQYEFTIPTTKTTTEKVLTSKKMTSSWKRVPTITPYPVKQLQSNSNKKKQSLATYHWGSSGSMKKPSRPRPPPSTPVPIVMNTLSTPIFDTTELTSHVDVEHPLSIPGTEMNTGKPSTNIWYKPIINHFTSLSSDTHSSSSSNFPLIFKVWSFKNGSLKLENEKGIPAWAINGFQIKDGSVLNIDQIPQALQTLISAAIAKNKMKKDKKNKRRPQTQQISESTTIHPVSDLANKKEEIVPNSAIDLSSVQNDPLNVNYVIWKTDSSNFRPPVLPDITKFNTPQSSTTAKPTVQTPSQTETQSPISLNYLNQYLQFLTTPKPSKVVIKVPKAPDTIKDSWTKLEKLISQSLIKATPIEQSLALLSTPAPDSLPPSKKTEDPELLSNLAAVAILISYMSNMKSKLTSTTTPQTPLSTTPSPSNDFNAAMFQLFQQILQKNDPTQSTQRVQIGEEETVTHSPQEYESKYPVPSTTKKPSTRTTTERATKTLLLKGIIKKGKKKKKRRLKKRRFKRKKLAFLQQILQLFKKPKSYWVDFKFDVDFHELLKKKFLYFLALKYAPVFFVLALGLVPLGLVIIPLLYKILWLKKKPKYIRVPVPYPKPYPVHPYHPHHPSYSPHDLQFAADSSGMSDSIHKGNPGIFSTPGYDNFLMNDEALQQQIHGIADHEMTSAHLEDYSNGPKPHVANKAYSLGFDLGSKLGSVTNTHDKEVLQILIENKKNKIDKLLENWKLLQTGKSTTPYTGLEGFEKEYTAKSMKRRKRK